MDEEGRRGEWPELGFGEWVVAVGAGLSAVFLLLHWALGVAAVLGLLLLFLL